MVRAALEAEGYEVREGAERAGRPRWEAAPVDFVISDLYMPTMDGLTPRRLWPRSPCCRGDARTVGGLPSARLILLGLDELKTAGEGRGRQSAALKYFASGWWKTSADTDASGSIMKPSVSVTPIRSSGRSSRQSVA